MQSGGNQIVAGPFRCRLGQKRSLYLIEALAVEEAADRHGGLVAQLEVVTEAGAAQVQVAILEPQVLGGGNIVLNGERGCPGLVQQKQRRGQHFDLAGTDGGIYRFRISLQHRASNHHHILRPQPLRLLVNFRGLVGFDKHLGHPFTIPQIDEDKVSQIAASGHPAHQHHFLTAVAQPQLPAMMGSLHSSQRI